MPIFNHSGFAIALDDLTLDHVPFALIEKLQPTQIKLARGVVNSLNNALALPIVQSLAAVGVDSGFAVVAKGIETVEHELSAINAGCQLGQGYRFTRPVNLDDLRTQALA